MLLGGIPPVTARLGPSWSYQEIFERSELVVIATFLSTKDTDERSTLTDVEPPIKVIGVTTEFEVQLVLKGSKDIKRFRLHHYRFENAGDATWVNAPQLIRLPTASRDGVHYGGHSTFLMFLIKEADGRYAPATGQTDPAFFSVRDLTCG